MSRIVSGSISCSVARSVVAVCILLAASPSPALAQRDPQALTLVSQSLQAADGTTVLTDVTLTGRPRARPARILNPGRSRFGR